MPVAWRVLLHPGRARFNALRSAANLPPPTGGHWPARHRGELACEDRCGSSRRPCGRRSGLIGLLWQRRSHDDAAVRTVDPNGERHRWRLSTILDRRGGRIGGLAAPRAQDAAIPTVAGRCPGDGSARVSNARAQPSRKTLSGTELRACAIWYCLSQRRIGGGRQDRDQQQPGAHGRSPTVRKNPSIAPVR